MLSGVRDWLYRNSVDYAKFSVILNLFFKRNAEPHKIRCSPLIMKEMQTKATMMHHLTPARKDIIKKSRNNKC